VKFPLRFVHFRLFVCAFHEKRRLISYSYLAICIEDVVLISRVTGSRLNVPDMVALASYQVALVKTHTKRTSLPFSRKLWRRLLHSRLFILLSIIRSWKIRRIDTGEIAE